MAKKKISNAPQPNKTELLYTEFALFALTQLPSEKISSKKFEDIFERVAELNANSFENDEAFELAANYDLENLVDDNGNASKEKIIDRIKQDRVVNLYKTMGYFHLCKGEGTDHLPNAQENLASTLHTLGISDADQTASDIFSGKMTDEGAEKLFNLLQGRTEQLKKLIQTDLKYLETQKDKNFVIENIRDSLGTAFLPKKLEYICYGVERKIVEESSGKRKSVAINKDEQAKEKFQADLREDFNKNAKSEFYKFFGNMLDAGQTSAGNTSVETQYRRFHSTMVKKYGDAAIDTALGLSGEYTSDKEKEDIRQKAFSEKTEELYFKTVAALICEKETNFNEDKSCNWDVFVRRNIKSYIGSLLKNASSSDIMENLAFRSPNSTQSRSEDKRDVDDIQPVSIHHGGLTIASTADFCAQAFPEKSYDERFQVARELTNDMAQFIYVIGTKKHQSLEPESENVISPKTKYKKKKITIVVDAESKNMLMTARVSPTILRKAMAQLPKDIQNGIKKHIPQLQNEKKNTSIDLAVKLPLPESSHMQKLREKARLVENRYKEAEDKLPKLTQNIFRHNIVKTV